MLVPGRRVVAFAWCLILLSLVCETGIWLHSWRHLRLLRDLFAVPIVATINYSTKNLDYLETHDWLGREANRTIVQFPLPGSAPV